VKKVLFAIPTLGGGGAERVLVTLLNNLDKEKYDITLFSIFGGGINKNYLNKDIKYSFYFKKLFRGNIHLFKLFSPEKLYKMMIKNEYDIVVSYLEGPTTRIISGCPYPNSKLINWVHTEIHNPKTISQSYRSIYEAINSFKEYNYTIFVSETAKEAYQNTFKDIKGKMLVKYNTVDNQLILTKSLEAVNDVAFDSKKINLVSVGRFTEQKGYDRLLNIVFKLAEEKFNIHLYLLGKGELEKKYHEIIDEFGLNKHVTILGFKENPHRYVRNCDLFLCSSYREGYSTAVTESLIVGTPVVTTLCSGMEEMLGENNEYGLITVNDEDALFEGIKRMITEPGLLNHYKRKAIERGGFFSKENTVEAVEELLDSL
jgi:glycosyltransferase involved in cell wall biosynthesis